MTRRRAMAFIGALCLSSLDRVRAFDSAVVHAQTFFASAMRAVAYLADAGQPVARSDADQLVVLQAQGDADAVEVAESILDRYTLARVSLDEQGMGHATIGAADRTLVEQGWTVFLLRVSNPAGLTSAFDVATRNQQPGAISQPNAEQKADSMRFGINPALAIERMWLDAKMQQNGPLAATPVEFRVIELFCRDRGSRTGYLGFGAGSSSSFRQSYSRAALSARKHPLHATFLVRAARDVALRVLDSDGVGCMASLLIKDIRGHVYPPQTMRLAPDLSFQPHVYRGDGEMMRLPDGEYWVTTWRGPEYLRQTQTVRISDSNRSILVRLKRWIDPARWGWYSGDTHIHAAGCAHYMHPTEGVTPETMIRHVRGEALAIGGVLTWGPAWYHQRQFFSGHAISPEGKLEYPPLQAANSTSLHTKPTPKDRESLLRYDIEVSHFPSSMHGHLKLLRMKEHDYPGTTLIEEWPSWNLPILKWARSQGGVVGYAHCSAGMAVSSTDLPNYEIPPFDSIGTNEAIVDVTHDACDFLSGCNGRPVTELNAWYHLLNCGFTLAMVGETDYPCFAPSIDARPGIGRSYVHLPQRPTDDAGYDAWMYSLQNGKLYYGDGRTHFLNFTVNGHMSGKKIASLKQAGPVDVRATVAALLEETPSSDTATNAAEQPWHLEHARIGNTRKVLVELIVNGAAMEKVELLADGIPHDLRFRTEIRRSSWVALRVLASGHTYPVFVIVGEKPICASRRSAEWLRRCVDALWNEKYRLIRESEQHAAAEAYEHARRTYDQIIADSEVP